MKYIFGLCYEEQPLEMRLQTMSLFCLHFISFVSCYRYTCSNVYNLNKMLVCIYTFRYMICVYEHAHHYHYIFFFFINYGHLMTPFVFSIAMLEIV